MIWQMETNAEWTLLPAPPGTLIEFLSIRLILDRLAAAYVARDSLGWRGDLCDLRDELRDRIPEMEKRGVEQYAFLAFQLAQVRGWLPQEMYQLPSRQWQLLLKTEVHRLNGVLESFRSFASLQRMAIRPCDPLDSLENVIRLIRPQAAQQHVQVTFHHPDLRLPDIPLDEDKFEQAMLNLALNAIEAMPAGGTLSIAAAVHDGWFQIEVADTGGGIPEAARSNVFKPKALTNEAYSISTAENAAEAWDLFQRQPQQLVITDLKMPGPSSGLDLIRQIKLVQRGIP